MSTAAKARGMPRPNTKQDQAFRSRARYVAYGGARGGGKSWFVRWKAVMMCVKYPGIKILITRKTYRELLNNHIAPMQEILNGMARYNKSDKMFTFPRQPGATACSTITFGYCASDADLGQYQGAEYDVWFADEAGQFQTDWLTKIDACVRGVNSFPKRTYYTLNPGGPSHGYFKRLFIDRRYEGNEHPEDYEFIQALVQDNTALMAQQPEYMRSLEKLPPKLRDAWLYGKWDVYEGQFFEDFRPEPDARLCAEAGITPEEARQQGRFTHVIAPLDLTAGARRGWSIYRSYDWGYNHPFSCGWWAVDYDGVAYRILELYGCTDTPNQGVKWGSEQQFQKIHEIEQQHPWLAGKQIQGVADPAIWDRSRGESIAETAARCGVYFTPGDNARIAGWMQCHYRLQFDSRGYPRMYVFNTCKGFLRTVPLMMYDDRKVEDLDTDLEDHISDEWRYFCMSRPVAPIAPVEQKTILSDPLNQFDSGRR